MGTLFERFIANFISNCCITNNGKDLVKSKGPRWFWEREKATEKSSKIKKDGRAMVEKSIGLQFKQTNEKKVSHKSV
mgnify:FL=1